MPLDTLGLLCSNREKIHVGAELLSGSVLFYDMQKEMRLNKFLAYRLCWRLAGMNTDPDVLLHEEGGQIALIFEDIKLQHWARGLYLVEA